MDIGSQRSLRSQKSTEDFTPGVVLHQFLDPTNKLASASNLFSLLYLSVLLNWKLG